MLVLWLPGTKDLNNYGMSNVELIYCTSIYNRPIISSEFNIHNIFYSHIELGNRGFFSIPEKLINNSSFTISTWLYTDDIQSDQCIMYCSNIASEGLFSMYISKGSLIINTGTSWTIENVFKEQNTWIYLAFVFDGTSQKVYSNGVQIASRVSTVNDFSSTNGLTIIGASVVQEYFYNYVEVVTIHNRTLYGKDHLGSPGRLHDFRFYDEALSPYEIKEISKGLICHYPLSYPAPNLLKKSVIAPSNWSHIYPSCTEFTGDGYYNHFRMVTTSSYENVYLPISVTSGKQYTFSISYQVLDDFQLWRNDRPFSFQILNAVPTNGDTFSKVIGNIIVGNNKMDGYERGSATFITTSDTIWLNIPGAYYKDGVVSYNKRVNFSHLKLEEGDHATPWIPYIDDYELHNTNNIIYDTSGYQHHGTISGDALVSNSSTPRYSSSMHFKGTNYITLPSPAYAKTISLWVKWDTIPSGQSVVFVDYLSGLGLGLMSSGILCSTSFSGNSKTFSKANLVANTWYHFVVINHYTGTSSISRKLYINGVEQAQTTNSSVWSYNIHELQIGKRSTTSDGFIGCISDFRMYVTELSEDDILELYHTPISLTKQGTLMTQGEYVEVM